MTIQTSRPITRRQRGGRETERKSAKCDAAGGLTGEEAVRSARLHGTNRLTKRKSRGFLPRFFSNFNDPVIRILLVALGVNLILLFRTGDPAETVGIGVAVLSATLLSTVSEYSSEKAFRRLSEAGAANRSRVRRDGRVTEVPSDDVVVGDRVLLGAGEPVPADGRVVSGRLQVEQAALTGESREVEKYPDAGQGLSPEDPGALLRGSFVLGGSGEMEVRRVGDATYLGGISKEVQTETRDSPLKLRLKRLASQISRFGYVAAAFVTVAYLLNAFVFDSGFSRTVILVKLSDPVWLFSILSGALMLGLTVVIMAVPEGLPLMVAVVLASNSRKMVRDKVLVRRSTGIEAAGSMNILFTDKTGTLTEGKLGIASVILEDGEALPDLASLAGKAPETAEALFRNIRVNSEASVGGAGAERVPLGGNATERALLRELLSIGAGEAADGNALWKLPFDSERKYSAACLADETLYKGAPEVLWPALAAPPSPGFAAALSEATKSGKRVILFARGPARGEREGRAGIGKGLAPICALALSDALRSEAPGAVRDLRGAGIRVVMITGDNRETASAIASECGILGGGVDLALTGRELARMSDGQILSVLPRLGVVARALPGDKSRLVAVAQEAGMVVGMTGDGINDAPALRRADIGFAMGDGTGVAREAGDVIILDNNLASVVRAVLYGRTVFKNIRKFITLQLTMNCCAVGVSMLGPFLGVDEPVTVVQMLWINMIMDTLGGLAFAGEAPLPSYMKEPPKRRDEPILNRYMIHTVACLGAYTVALCMLLLKWSPLVRLFRPSSGDVCLLTAHFALFIFASVLNCFGVRTDRLNGTAGLKSNRTFLTVMGLVAAVQILFVYLGGEVLRTVPLTARELLTVLLLSLSVLPAEFARKCLWRLGGGREGY